MGGCVGSWLDGQLDVWMEGRVDMQLEVQMEQQFDAIYIQITTRYICRYVALSDSTMHGMGMLKGFRL